MPAKTDFDEEMRLQEFYLQLDQMRRNMIYNNKVKKTKKNKS